MFRRFCRDRNGNFAMMTAIAIVPLMGGLALAVDYTEISRQRQNTLNALDAAGVATARRYVEGGTEAELKTYALNFFKANLNGVDPANANLTVVLPSDQSNGGGVVKLSASLKYKPYFLPVFTSLLGGTAGTKELVAFAATNEVQLKNTLEVALVLDNSGSMSEKGGGSGKERMTLMKDAAKQLIDALAASAGQIKQVSEPVKFGVVPFAASVNVGPGNAGASWMDQDGISPVHHENFDWSSMSSSVNPTKYVQQIGGIWYKKGVGWLTEANQKITRFSMYKDIKYKPSLLGVAQYASWAGCVEARPSPYDLDNTTPSSATPATLFVPMFAPDEAGNKWTKSGSSVKDFGMFNSWWDDGATWTSTSTNSTTQMTRQKSMAKYFDIAPYGTFSSAAATYDDGPNSSCTTTPITPLTDVSVATGKDKVKAAIDAMQPLGGTNVHEGLAWGWRVVSSNAPFTEGRNDSEHGNDKVVILLTDGANTYYTPGSLGYNDYAGNKSIYSSHGYTGVNQSGDTTTRLFAGTTVTKTDYSNANYSKAMDERLATLCGNAKGKNVLVMTVAVDLSSTNTQEAAQIAGLKSCSSESRFRKDGTGKAAKLFWNTTGSNLSETFKEIADELSNLRITS